MSSIPRTDPRSRNYFGKYDSRKSAHLFCPAAHLAGFLFSPVLHGSLKKNHAANLVTGGSWKPHRDVCVCPRKHETETPLGFGESSGIYVLHILRDPIFHRTLLEGGGKKLKKETQGWRRARAWEWITDDVVRGHGFEEAPRKNKAFMQMEQKVAGRPWFRCCGEKKRCSSVQSNFSISRQRFLKFLWTGRERKSIPHSLRCAVLVHTVSA